MARAKKSKKAKKEEEEVIIEDVPTEEENEFVPEEATEEEEIIDFVSYVTESNITMGTDFKKKIRVKMDNKIMEVAIRPITDKELRFARQGEELGQGSVEQNIVQTAVTDLSGKKTIPFSVLEDKIPAGVTSYLANEILGLSGFNLTEDDLRQLKKN